MDSCALSQVIRYLNSNGAHEVADALWVARGSIILYAWPIYVLIAEAHDERDLQTLMAATRTYTGSEMPGVLDKALAHLFPDYEDWFLFRFTLAERGSPRAA